METALISNEQVSRYTPLFKKYICHNFESSSSFKLFIFRLFSICLIIPLIYVCTRLSHSTLSSPSECISDDILSVTSAFNSYFTIHHDLKNFFIILSSAFIDMTLIVFIVEFIFFCKTWRQIVTLFMFYSVRAILQSINILGFPEGYIWSFPGMYSIVVTYTRSSDFFYSGHVGVMLFCAIDYHNKKNFVMFWFSLFCCVFEGWVMLIVRCHYAIDIIAGLIFSHYFWMIGETPSKYADKYLGYHPWKFMQDEKEPIV